MDRRIYSDRSNAKNKPLTPRGIVISSSSNQPDDRLLTSIQNPWIKQLRRLQQASERKLQARFLCEGTHLLQEAIATHWPIDTICFTQTWLDKHYQMLEAISPAVRQQMVSEQVLKHIATTEQPDGVIAIARFRINVPQRNKRMLGLGVETLQEPGNLGTLIRASVATQADGIWMSPDSVDAVHPKVLRASAGQWFRQPPITTSLQIWLEQCRTQSIQILAAATGGRSFWDFDLNKPTVFLLGNEGAGLTKSLRQLADEVISIPMAAGVESLNVGTTGALLLYEARRQRFAKNPHALKP